MACWHRVVYTMSHYNFYWHYLKCLCANSIPHLAFKYCKHICDSKIIFSQMGFWILAPPTHKKINSKEKKFELLIPKSHASIFHKYIPGIYRCSTKLSPQLP